MRVRTGLIRRMTQDADATDDAHAIEVAEKVLREIPELTTVLVRNEDNAHVYLVSYGPEDEAAGELQAVDMTGCAWVECEWLPHSLPAILVSDARACRDEEPGLVLLLNTSLADGEEADEPDHVERHGHQVLGPFAPEELVQAVAATGKRCRIEGGLWAEDEDE